MDTNCSNDARGTKRPHGETEIEDIGQKRHRKGQTTLPIVTCVTESPSQRHLQRSKSWRETLGPPPPRGSTRVSLDSLISCLIRN